MKEQVVNPRINWLHSLKEVVDVFCFLQRFLIKSKIFLVKVDMMCLVTDQTLRRNGGNIGSQARGKGWV